MKEEFILVAIPMESEMDALKERFSDRMTRKTVGGIRGYTFNSPQGAVFAYASRVGRTQTAFDLAVLNERLAIRSMINLGTAGSLCDFVRPLDVVLATSSAYYDVDLTSFGYRYGQMSGCPSEFKTNLTNVSFSNSGTYKIHLGLIVTSESFMTKTNIDQTVLQRFDHPLAVDMEGAAFGHVAYMINRPYVLIRAISDEIGSDNNTLQHEQLILNSCRNAVDVLAQILGYPSER